MESVVLMGDPRIAAVPLAECADRLVDVHGAVRVDGRKADDEGLFAFLRSDVLTRLVKANALLPSDVEMLLIEGYCPPSLQRFYFDRYRSELRDLHPSRSPEEIHTAASRSVSPPEVAPHCAGAAVDVTLCTSTGLELDMGTVVNASPEHRDGACYTDAPIGLEARHHRDLLVAALSAVDLVNYPTEWWHWSFGDRYWAYIIGADAAIYGPSERTV